MGSAPVDSGVQEPADSASKRAHQRANPAAAGSGSFESPGFFFSSGNTAKGGFMYKYAIWVRINQYQTVNTFVYAENDYQAKLIAEAQYGVGNVLNYTRAD